MTREEFEKKRAEALQYVVTDSNDRISTAITKRQASNAAARLIVTKHYLDDFKENGFWNDKNTWAYENIYKDLPHYVSVSPW